MASALPDGQRQVCVQQMLDIVVQPMQGILQAAAAEGGGGSAPGTPTAGGGGAAAAPAATAQLQLVLPLMERVTTVFRAVKDPADVAEALVRLWPWIEAALGALVWGRLLLWGGCCCGAGLVAPCGVQPTAHLAAHLLRACLAPSRPAADRFVGNAPAIERICRAPRYAIRSAGKAAAGAVPLLVASLPARFEATRQPCFLYVASELIKTFGDEPARDLELGACVGGRVGAAWACPGPRSRAACKPSLQSLLWPKASRSPPPRDCACHPTFRRHVQPHAVQRVRHAAQPARRGRAP